MTGKVQVIARRGDAERAPENTIPAFARAIELGADGVEFDVHLTSDEHLVVHHFYNLGATNDGAGPIYEKTFSELRNLDAGSWFNPAFENIQIPLMAEVLALCNGKVNLEIDLKDLGKEFLMKVIREIEEFGLIDGVELTTAHIPLLVLAKQRAPMIKTGAFFYEPPGWMPLRLAQLHALDWAVQLQLDVVHLHNKLITPDYVNQLQKAGFKVHASNLDTKEEIERGIGFGIDSFSTGHLELALRVRDFLII